MEDSRPSFLINLKNIHHDSSEDNTYAICMQSHRHINDRYVILKEVRPEHALINLKVRMSCDLLYWQHRIVFLPALVWRNVSNLPFSTNDLHIRACHLPDHGAVSASIGVIRALGLGHIVTAAVGDHNVVRLAEEGAVSSCDQDCGARGSPEQGHGAVVLLVRAPASQGADPGVSVSCLLKWSLCLDNRSIDLRQQQTKKQNKQPS